MNNRPEEAWKVLELGQESADDPGQLFRFEERMVLLLKGPSWDRTFEQAAGHFLVRSDTDRKTCREVAREVEQAWKDYERLLGRVEMPEGVQVPVFLFSGSASYHAYAKSAISSDMQHTAGVFDRQLQAILAWNSPSRDTLLRTIRHEVLHQYLDARMGSIPSWFNEGLAEYYEIMEHNRGLPVVGGPHPDHVRTLDQSRQLIDLRNFVQLSPIDFYGSSDQNYAQAWAFIHFLRETSLDHRKRFEAVWDNLDNRVENAAALDAAFDGVDWEALNAAFLAHIKTLAD